MTQQIMVTVAHLRAADLCSRGARQWFSRHGLDYQAFITKGVPIEAIEATGDALGALVASKARAEAAGEDE